MAIGKFGNAGSLPITSVGTDLVPITPSDTVDLPGIARAIRCKGNGTGGIIRFTAYSGEVRNSYIDAGETLDVMAVRVHDTGTDATGLEAII